MKKTLIVNNKIGRYKRVPRIVWVFIWVATFIFTMKALVESKREQEERKINWLTILILLCFSITLTLFIIMLELIRQNTFIIW